MALWKRFGLLNTKTGIPETVALPAENTSLVDIFERNFQNLVHVMPLSLWIKSFNV